LAVYFDDLHSYDPVTMTWTLLSGTVDDARPSGRSAHGFTSALGKLYLHGGFNYEQYMNTAGKVGECKQKTRDKIQQRGMRKETALSL
jgi:hypothetical protein